MKTKKLKVKQGSIFRYMPTGKQGNNPLGYTPCQGSTTFGGKAVPNMNAEQLAWMQANKPLYTGCSLTEALPHLPPHLRHV